MKKQKFKFKEIDLVLIDFFRGIYIPVARFSIFLIYFWFGILKVFHISPASPLAKALVAQTVGVQYFDALFISLALLECLIGVLFLFPKATRTVIPLLILHLLIVCSPLVFIPHYTWQSFLVPTLEGQYIIKNAVVIAVAIGIAASATPLKFAKTR
jgi:uncharacterized membrane protein YphA (DoxX/SURF4 family)